MIWRALFGAGCGVLAMTVVMLTVDTTGPVGLLIVAIIIGGLGGGFTLGLSGGERYGLKMPGTTGIDHKWDPGFLGDLFVGLMSGFLGIGVVLRGVSSELFLISKNGLVELWFIDFSVAFVSGFLGLKLVKAVSERFFDKEELKDKMDKVDANAGATAFLTAQEGITAGQLDEAEKNYRRALALDPHNQVRALIGIARVQRRKNNLVEAIATLDDAIRMGDKEHMKGRTAVAYWNRACYKALTKPPNLEGAVDDLQASTQITPSYRLSLYEDEDLKALHGNARFQALAAQGTK